MKESLAPLPRIVHREGLQRNVTFPVRGVKGVRPSFVGRANEGSSQLPCRGGESDPLGAIPPPLVVGIPDGSIPEGEKAAPTAPTTPES